MLNIVWVAAGGAAGAVLRYMTGLILIRCYGKSRLITGTVAVNCIGCFLAGIFFDVIQSTIIINNEIFLLLYVGLLGSYTTFSSFTLEFIQLTEISLKNSALYLSLQLGIAIAMVFFGYSLSGLITGIY